MPHQKSKALIETDDLKNIWRIVAKNWGFYIFFPIICLILAYIYKNKVTEVYEAKTQILLKSAEVYQYQETINRSIGYYEAYQDIVNQMRVIRSADLIFKTTAKLNLDVSYFIIGRLKTLEVYQYVPFSVEASIYNPDFYEKEFHLRLIDTASYELTFLKDNTTIKRNGVFGESLVSADFNCVVNKNEYLTGISIGGASQINYMYKIHSQEYLIETYQGGLDVTNAQWTAIMDITLRDVVPERAAAFLDTLAAEYIKYTIHSQIQINENTLKFIDRQMEEVVGILNEIENELDLYKDQRAILDLSREQNEYFQKLVEYDGDDRKLKIQVQTIDALEKYITSLKDERLLPPSFYILENDDYLRKTLNELYTLQISSHGILFDETTKSLTIDEINQKILLLKNDLLGYIENTRKAINSKAASVREQISYYEGLLRGIPKTERQMVNFRRKLEVNEKLYSYLLERRANTIIARAGIVPQTKVIESPHVTGMVEPNEQQIYYSFLCAGLILALLATFFHTAFFDRIESVEELKNITRLPILGDIPHIKKSGDQYLIVDSNPRSLITESYRLIRTNLEYFASQQNSKVILVTSNNPNEGKTFCVINLGAILAKAGKKTVLVELDLHKPKITKVFNLSYEKGVSQYLTGRAQLDGVIQNSGVDNLTIISAGTIPPNPSELVLSAALPEMIKKLKEEYEYVLIDTPPIGVITDALVLMRYSDINLFVINAKRPNKTDVLSTHQIVEDNRLTNFGFILNNVKVQKARYYYKYYRYNYNYYYGSGYSGEYAQRTNGSDGVTSKKEEEKKG